MKTVSPALKAHLAEEVTTLASLWRISRLDGVKFFFTDHDEDIVFRGDTYIPGSGFNKSATQTTSGFSVDNLNVDGFINHDTITVNDIRTGKFDDADVIISIVNYQDLTMGEMIMRRGNIGEVTYSEFTGNANSEIRGLMQKFTKRFIDKYQSNSRKTILEYNFDFSRAGYRESFTVESKMDRGIFNTSAITSTTEPTWWNYGHIIWQTGNNTGLMSQVKRSDIRTGLVEVLIKPPNEIEVGDTGLIHAGFDGSIVQARDKFDIVADLECEPFLPGNDEFYRYGTN